MSDIVFIGTQNSKLTASNIDINGNKYFGIVDDNNNCILTKNSDNSGNSILLGSNIVIKQIEIGEDDKIYLRCIKNNINDITIGGKTYGSSISVNPFIILNPDMSINTFTYIDGIISFYVSNNIVYFLLFMDNLKINIIEIINYTFQNNPGQYGYYLLNLNLNNKPESKLTTLYIGGNELVGLFDNVYISSYSLIVTGRISKPVKINFENKTLDLSNDYGEGISLVLNLSIEYNKIIYISHDIITGVYINKVLATYAETNINLMCDILSDYVYVKTLFISITINKNNVSYPVKKGILKLNPSLDELSVVCIAQSDIEIPFYMNRNLDNNEDIYCVTQTDNDGNIIINNDVYKTNKLRQLIIKFDYNGKFKWIKELKATPVNNDLVNNIISYNGTIYLFGTANNGSMSLGNISYTNAENQNKVYSLEFTNREQFTNLTSESEFTPTETLDLITITKNKPIDNPNKPSNKTGIIIGATVGGILLVILILVLLYLHFNRKIF